MTGQCQKKEVKMRERERTTENVTQRQSDRNDCLIYCKIWKQLPLGKASSGTTKQICCVQDRNCLTPSLFLFSCACTLALRGQHVIRKERLSGQKKKGSRRDRMHQSLHGPSTAHVLGLLPLQLN